MTEVVAETDERDLAAELPVGLGTLDGWRARFDELDRCRWPGPRPLTTTDVSTLLVGRKDDIANFRRVVRDRRLVMLTGSTGVGKTSLLERGLVPELALRGYQVGVCRDWSGSAKQSAGAVAFLAQKVHAQFDAHLEPDDAGAAVFARLEQRLGQHCVIVLDQFEELMRDAPRLTAAIYRLLARLNEQTTLKFVISFRSEFLHEIRDLESRIKKPQTMQHISLRPLDPSFAYEVVTAPNRADSTDPAGRVPPLAITEEVAKVCAERWQQALQGTVEEALSSRSGRVGLLHLQALLYVLSDRALYGNRVQLEHLEALDTELGAEGLTQHQFFSLVLQASVDTKVRRCEVAAEGLDTSLVAGTVRVLAEAVPHLSSAGYKLIRDVRDLAASALGDDLETLRRALSAAAQEPTDDGDGPATDDQVDALIDWLIGLIDNDASAAADLLDVPRAVVAASTDEGVEAGRATPWASRLHAGASPESADRTGASSGPMLGLSPAAVLIEELRRFTFAVEWLRISSLARLSTPGVGGANIALVHDGFGIALERWSRRTADSARCALAAITAPNGAEFVWRDRADIEAVTGRDGEPVVLANLRWRGAWISSEFSHAAFVNCDLRGAGFDRCRFTSVSFINCLLDGAMFTDCTVVGSAAEAFDWALKEPAFSVPVSPALRTSLVRHREQHASGSDGANDDNASLLFSPGAGRPAVISSHIPESALSWTDQSGGLVVYGGRVSALTLRGNRFEASDAESARVSFRHVAGSGVEIVEQRGGDVEIHGSALRHLTITAPVSTGAAAPADDGVLTRPDRLRVTVVGSSLAQAYLGDGLTGTFTATNSSLLQFWNNAADLHAVSEDCSYLHVVNIDVSNSGAMLPDDVAIALATVSDQAKVQDRLHRMDYRRDGSRSVEHVASTPVG